MIATFAALLADSAILKKDMESLDHLWDARVWLPGSVTATLPPLCTIYPLSHQIPDGTPLDATLFRARGDNDLDANYPRHSVLRECVIVAHPSLSIVLDDGSTLKSLHCPSGSRIQFGRPPRTPVYVALSSLPPLDQSVMLDDALMLPWDTRTLFPAPVVVGVGGITLLADTFIPAPMFLTGDMVTRGFIDLPSPLIHEQDWLLDMFEVPTGSRLHEGTVLPWGTRLPAGIILRRGTIVPAGTQLPDYTVLPPMTLLPRGTLLPEGLVLPRGTRAPESVVQMIEESRGPDFGYHTPPLPRVLAQILGLLPWDEYS
ncbi:hypothetical protein Micbo1qcDRAFT_209108 [Microdochium bolleyi]|uniref:Uncharacterized protein n=1 Tax=Microdochium bolleyi TaxID=196109 RepID=A0A136IN90_9PEZI|nr:hypothetical protein Micbo1qcDRAFT_209108 [Microdochium bolleyi]